MEFRFNVNKILPKRINKITSTLVPVGFVASERREYNDCQRYMTRILDDMGEASANAQGLNRAITSAIKLRDTDHILYIMVDREGNNGLGSVVGLLKTGSKTLFMFDDNGLHYRLKPRCILDFYIHESRQRMGLGNELYQHMLKEENLRPIKLAIDRPSEKLLAFLKKHYGLSSIIPQNNQFVVFQGFFDDEIDDSKLGRYSTPYSTEPTISSPRTQNVQQQSPQQMNNNNNNVVNRPPSMNGNNASRSFGRFAAARPPCSMGTIIHDTIPFGQQEYTGSATSTPRSSRGESHSVCSDSEGVKRDNVEPSQDQSAQVINIEKKNEDEAPAPNDETASMTTETSNPDKDYNNAADQVDANLRSVSPSTTIQDDEKPGHLDLKFYHSPLW